MSDRDPQTASDPAALCGWIEQHVRLVGDAQSRLQQVLDQKQTALQTTQTEAVATFVENEAAIAAELETLRQTRDRWLAAMPLGPDIHSLGEAATAAGASDELTDRIDSVRRQAAVIQQQNWAHWVLAQRSSAHFAEMLGLIARRGQTAATYGEQPPESGGGILDAAA